MPCALKIHIMVGQLLSISKGHSGMRRKMASREALNLKSLVGAPFRKPSARFATYDDASFTRERTNPVDTFHQQTVYFMENGGRFSVTANLHQLQKLLKTSNQACSTDVNLFRISGVSHTHAGETRLPSVRTKKKNDGINSGKLQSVASFSWQLGRSTSPTDESAFVQAKLQGKLTAGCLRSTGRQGPAGNRNCFALACLYLHLLLNGRFWFERKIPWTLPWHYVTATCKLRREHWSMISMINEALLHLWFLAGNRSSSGSEYGSLTADAAGRTFLTWLLTVLLCVLLQPFDWSARESVQLQDQADTPNVQHRSGWHPVVAVGCYKSRAGTVSFQSLRRLKG